MVHDLNHCSDFSELVVAENVLNELPIYQIGKRDFKDGLFGRHLFCKDNRQLQQTIGLTGPVLLARPLSLSFRA